MQNVGDMQAIEGLRRVGGYAQLLESLLDQHCQSHRCSSRIDFRAYRPTDFQDLISMHLRSENVNRDAFSTTEESDDEWDEIDDPTKEIRLHTQKLTVCTLLLRPF